MVSSVFVLQKTKPDLVKIVSNLKKIISNIFLNTLLIISGAPNPLKIKSIESGILRDALHKKSTSVQYSCNFPKILLPIKEIGLLLHIENKYVYNIINLITINDYV